MKAEILRGKRLFKRMVGVSEKTEVLRKGRNETLLKRRNSCLLTRYYYLGFYKNKGYEETVQLLEDIFFISTDTISRIILQNREMIEHLKETAPRIGYLRAIWPQYKW